MGYMGGGTAVIAGEPMVTDTKFSCVKLICGILCSVQGHRDLLT